MFWRKTLRAEPETIIEFCTCKACSQEWLVDKWQPSDTFCRGCRDYIEQRRQDATFERRYAYFKENPPC